MRHRTAGRLMSLQMDRALRPEEESSLLDHVERCPRCQATWAAMLRAGHLLGQPSWLDPPPGLVGRIRARLPSSRKAVVAPAPVWVRASLLAAGASALLLLGLVGATLLLESILGRNEWALVRRENWGAFASAWRGVVRLLGALGPVVRAVWESLRWPWLALFLLALAAVVVLWAWLWRRLGGRVGR